jgi:aromatic ring-opening dioxygenase catalytic subunit (LigB family)
MTHTKFPTYFLSHGGGPWPWLEGDVRRAYVALEASLAGLLATLPALPKAILMVTAHWETRDFALSSSPTPAMLYDYGGFPEHTYHIHYKAPGQPDLAARATGLLQAAGLASHMDAERGFDHGTFSLMQVVRPQADIPVVQLSVQLDMNPQAHIAAGKALAPLRDEGVLIIGSGLSYHNLRLWGAGAAQPSAAFDAWLQAALVAHSSTEREKLLHIWAQAPAARIAHPREDHLLPLMVAVGAANEEAGVCIYHESDFMSSITASSFRFG